jgi:hypothetical protein
MWVPTTPQSSGKNSRLFWLIGHFAEIKWKFSRLFARILSEVPFQRKCTGEIPVHRTTRSIPAKYAGEFPFHDDRNYISRLTVASVAFRLFGSCAVIKPTVIEQTNLPEVFLLERSHQLIAEPLRHQNRPPFPVVTCSISIWEGRNHRAGPTRKRMAHQLNIWLAP